MFDSIFKRIAQARGIMAKNDENTILGEMLVSDGKEISLKAIRIKGKLEGLLFSWDLEQEYVNESGGPLEIIYSFPLGYKSVLLGMKARIGDRELEGVVIEARQAEDKYEKAICEGDSAILVQESGGGIYTANLGNIAPGEKVCISMQCARMQAFDGERVRISLPLLTGERFGDPHKEGILKTHETARTSLAAKYSFDAQVDIMGEMARARIACPSWDVDINDIEGGKRISLKKPDLANRDFVIVLSDLPSRSSAIYTPDKEETMLCAAFSPLIPQEEKAPLNLKILVDCSGSMDGTRIQEARKGLAQVVNMLKSGDQVSYSRFGSDVVHDTPGLVPCDEDFLERLGIMVGKLEADLGGTSLEAALLSTFKLANSGEDASALLLITDGDVWAIDKIVATARESGHRLFIIGVGSAPGEYLLQRMAEESGGVCEMVTAEEDIAAAIERMFKRMRAMNVSKIQVDWGTEPLWTSRLPKNVYDGETLCVFARFAAVPERAPILKWHGVNGEGEVQAPSLEASNDYDFTRLGRKCQLDESEDKELRLRLALDYQLVTKQTSLILVMEREGELKIKGLPTVENVPQMRAEDNFMHFADSAVKCFMSVPIMGAVQKFYDIAPDFKEIFSDRIVNDDENLHISSSSKRPEDIIEYMIHWSTRHLLEGYEFSSIFNLFITHCPMMELRKILHNILGTLSMEKLFAIFLIWLLQQNPDIERHLLRGARYEIRDVDKEQIEHVKRELDKWRAEG